MEGTYLQELKNRQPGFRFNNRRIGLEYQAHAASRHSTALRLQLLLAGMMICSVCLLDFTYLDRTFAETAVMLRIGVMLPPLLLMVILTGLPNAHKFLQPAGIFSGLAVGLTSLAIGLEASRNGVPQVYAGYEIITVFVYLFLGLRVHNAVITGMALFFAFVFFVNAGATDVVSATYQSVFLLFLNVLGAVGNYQLSKTRRSLFLEERILSYRANHDALTGLPNRRAFDALLKGAWDSAKALEKPLALLMIDIDHFKKYNDIYGHQAGDKTITEVGAILAGSLQRPQDFAGRYGGEEFVVVLFDAAKQYAVQLADRIRNEMLLRNIEHRGSNVAPCVSLSIGLAYVSPATTSRSMTGLVQMADEALYAAKEHGRNCVVDADRTSHITATGMFYVSPVSRTGDVQTAAANVVES